MTAWSAAYYVYCLSGLLFLTILILSVHRLMWLAYVGQSLLALVYIAVLDGDLQPLLSIDPSAHERTIVISGCVLLVYAFVLVARVTQPDPLADRLKMPLYAAALASALLPLGLVVTNFEIVHTLVLSFLAAAFLAQALPPLTWGFLPGPLRPRAMPVIQISVVALAVGTAVFSSYSEISDQQWLIARRVALVGIVTSGMITMMYMTYIIERMRAASARRAVHAAESQAATNLALLEAERDYSRVRELAMHRTEQLSSVSHDLRQPLGSLRATLDGLIQEQPVEVVDQANQALDYLDQLAKSFVDGSIAKTSTLEGDIESVPVQVLLQSLEQMFRGEAQSKGIAIRVVRSSLSVRAAPLPLMRALANLVANALKHAECDRILLGARRKASIVVLQVMDDGRGLEGPREQAESNGSGLGLNIVQDLSEQHGYLLQSATIAGAGSCFSLTVRRA